MLRTTHRSSHQRCSGRKGVLRNFTKCTGRKHLCQSLFFNRVPDLSPATLLKTRIWHSCFPVNFVKFLRTPFLQNTSGGCSCTQRRNQITYFYMYVSPFGVRRDRMYEEINWNLKKKIGQKSSKSINECEMKFYLLYNSICKRKRKRKRNNTF